MLGCKTSKPTDYRLQHYRLTMRIRILGSAAGGGFPQWNCGCGNCVAVRAIRRKNPLDNNPSFKARTQAQLALSADGFHVVSGGSLSPDLASQIENCPDLHPRSRLIPRLTLRAILRFLALSSAAAISITCWDYCCSANCSLCACMQPHRS